MKLGKGRAFCRLCFDPTNQNIFITGGLNLGEYLTNVEILKLEKLEIIEAKNLVTPLSTHGIANNPEN